MFLQAKTNEEKLKWLEEMIKECPKHKSSEKMLANLKTRYIKLKEKIEIQSKKGKGSNAGKIIIRKEDLQAVIIGLTNSGKSSLLSKLTNASPYVADYDFTTKEPVLGVLNYQGVQIQLIENPAFESEYYDRGLTNTTDVIIMLINSEDQILKIEKELERAHGKRIIVYNKTDLLSENEKRKLLSRFQSKKYNFVFISTESGEGIEELKEKLFKSFNKIRIFTKEPGKIRSNFPIVLKEGSTVRDVAEKILKGFSKNVKQTKITGPSSKFSNQVVSLDHKLKDLDTVEFKTK